jgi:peptidyl-prolyl cis-trans isomerase B (cyclophilin B)
VKFTIALTIFFTFILHATAKDKPIVLVKTTSGDIEVELYPEKAPETVANFLKYTKDGFYDGTIFHRVIPTFMIQGGGFTEKMEQKKTNAPIKNEAANGLSNSPAFIAMARTSDPHSATSQFFINVGENSFLDHKNTSKDGYGYAVFGKVVKGMDVVNKIKNVKTGNRNGYSDVPLEPVIIKSMVLR